MRPRVSVIIPTYNRRDLVQEAIDSVLAQTYQNFELWVVDDGSTDDTGWVIKHRYGDRVRYLCQENQGESAARNHAIRRANGEYLAFLDDDDRFLPAMLERTVAMLDANPDVGAVSGTHAIIDTQGRALYYPQKWNTQAQMEVTFDQLSVNNLLSLPASLVRKACLDQIGLFDESIRYSEDWELWLRLVLRYPILWISDVLCEYRLRRRGGLPQPDSIEHILADHLKAVDKIFARLLVDEKERDRLKRRALASRYARMAFVCYAVNSLSLAKDYLTKAVSLAPSIWEDEPRLIQVIADYAAEFATGGEDQDALQFVEIVFANFPPELERLEELKVKVLSRVYINNGFKHYRCGEPCLTRRTVFQGLAHDLSWLGNRGVLSILVRSCLGGTVSWQRLEKAR